jgi:hypothetical protein
MAVIGWYSSITETRKASSVAFVHTLSGRVSPFSPTRAAGGLLHAFPNRGNFAAIVDLPPDLVLI